MISKKILEYSVIFTNRATNLMSNKYQHCVRDITHNLCNVYKAQQCALIPGSGTIGMESVARQFANNKDCLIIRNGYFSYRWSQILDIGKITDKANVIKGTLDDSNRISPPDINMVCDWIENNKPSLVCAPHVETSTGVMLTNDYIKKIGKSVRNVGGLFCLDGIASGTVWINMKELNVDLYLTAPQKGWSSPASVGVVMLGQHALDQLNNTQSSSFTLDLSKWCDVSSSYQDGGFMYHCTVPTDSLLEFKRNIDETLEYGLDKCHENANILGNEMRHLLESKGYHSVASNDYKSPTVVVSYCDDNMVPSFLNQGIQVAGYVPFMLDEPLGLNTFRIGLFGLDKLKDTKKTLHDFNLGLQKIK